MNSIGVMQGRLVPPEIGTIQHFPRRQWAEEFKKAQLAGLDCIEWIFDEHGEDINPIAKNRGIEQVKELMEVNHIFVRSVCADYFMQHPFFRRSDIETRQTVEKFRWLLGRCKTLGVKRIVVPFIDNSEIRNSPERDAVIEILKEILPEAARSGIELHLETSLAPEPFADLLTDLDHDFVKVNYDSGNSASLGFHPREEFEAYGSRVGSVHIKDRLTGGKTVPLGSGNADFIELREALNRVGYRGDFIMQVARGIPGDEVNWARKNKEFILKHLSVRTP